MRLGTVQAPKSALHTDQGYLDHCVRLCRPSADGGTSASVFYSSPIGTDSTASAMLARVPPCCH